MSSCCVVASAPRAFNAHPTRFLWCERGRKSITCWMLDASLSKSLFPISRFIFLHAGYTNQRVIYGILFLSTRTAFPFIIFVNKARTVREWASECSARALNVGENRIIRISAGHDSVRLSTQFSIPPSLLFVKHRKPIYIPCGRGRRAQSAAVFATVAFAPNSFLFPACPSAVKSQAKR